jgi:hypothetical protein
MQAQKEIKRGLNSKRKIRIREEMKTKGMEEKQQNKKRK